MESSAEAVVRGFLDALQGDGRDALEFFDDDAVYRVNAWNDPIGGRDAIAEELERQHALFDDVRIELVNIASAGNVVFTERIDRVRMMGKDVAIHITGVFEVGHGEKVIDWRDYFDMQEVGARLAS
jgi:limonene-1,2-epoxide hydrolase